MKTEKVEHQKKVHNVLTHSYMTYLMALFFGIIFSAIWPLKIFTDPMLLNTSTIILLLSTLLILWAQRSSKEINKENLSEKSFMNGPYAFTRNPTNLGLFFSMISFGIIINSLFVIFFTLIAFLLARLVFYKTEEKILENKYGEPYRKYKEIVKF